VQSLRARPGGGSLGCSSVREAGLDKPGQARGGVGVPLPQRSRRPPEGFFVCGLARRPIWSRPAFKGGALLHSVPNSLVAGIGKRPGGWQAGRIRFVCLPQPRRDSWPMARGGRAPKIGASGERRTGAARWPSRRGTCYGGRFASPGRALDQGSEPRPRKGAGTPGAGPGLQPESVPPPGATKAFNLIRTEKPAVAVLPDGQPLGVPAPHRGRDARNRKLDLRQPPRRAGARGVRPFFAPLRSPDTRFIIRATEEGPGERKTLARAVVTGLANRGRRRRPARCAPASNTPRCSSPSVHRLDMVRAWKDQSSCPSSGGGRPARARLQGTARAAPHRGFDSGSFGRSKEGTFGLARSATRPWGTRRRADWAGPPMGERLRACVEQVDDLAGGDSSGRRSTPRRTFRPFAAASQLSAESHMFSGHRHVCGIGGRVVSGKTPFATPALGRWRFVDVASVADSATRPPVISFEAPANHWAAAAVGNIGRKARRAPTNTRTHPSGDSRD